MSFLKLDATIVIFVPTQKKWSKKCRLCNREVTKCLLSNQENENLQNTSIKAEILYIATQTLMRVTKRCTPTLENIPGNVQSLRNLIISVLSTTRILIGMSSIFRKVPLLSVTGKMYL